MSTHSCVIAPHLKHSLSMAEAGKYGRMFPGVPAPETDQALLLMLGKSGSVMDEDARPGPQGEATDNPRIPAGFTFLGQLVAHDITADRSLLLHHSRLNELRNFRTPRLDLEAMYAAGTTGNPYLYDINDPDKLLLGINDQQQPADLPRNHQGRALLGDPRDDVHLIISQLHLAFLKFHNNVVDYLREQGVAPVEVFKQAQQLVRWHYQWIVVNEFLPLTVGEELVQDILTNGLKFYSYSDTPYIPIEFADAAYRYGHSQIRSLYTLNSLGAKGQVFPDCAGTCPVPQNRAIEWNYFFDMDKQHPPQPSKRIDTRLAHSLIDLPTSVVGDTEIPEEHSLAYRDLVRGEALDLPSGEALAEFMGVKPLTPEEVGLRAIGWQSGTPLWYYILKESEVRLQGEQLGEVGGRIIAEVLLGLIAGDPDSYLNAETDWQPVLPASEPGSFTITDMLRFARAV